MSSFTSSKLFLSELTVSTVSLRIECSVRFCFSRAYLAFREQRPDGADQFGVGNELVELLFVVELLAFEDFLAGNESVQFAGLQCGILGRGRLQA